jgi:outer membrane lipoprotein carrier protein
MTSPGTDTKSAGRRQPGFAGRYPARTGLLLLAAVLFGASSLAAGGDPLGETLDRFRTHYEGVRDLRARFFQRSLIASLGSEEVSRGELLYLRPGRLRWEVEDPERHVLVADGETLRMFSPADNILQIAPLEEGAVSQTALGFLFGEADLRRAFDVTLLDGDTTEKEGRVGDRGLALGLKPKQEASFERLEVRLDPGTLRVREVTIFDLLGNRTHLVLENTEENVGLEEANFTIRVPDDTEVIDLR